MFHNLGEFESKSDPFRDQPWIVTYTSVQWLVVNDLGKEYRGGKLGEQVAYQFGRIIRARSEKKLVTHITTNLSGNEINSIYGESVVSLIAESMTSCRVTGPDRRKVKRD